MTTHRRGVRRKLEPRPDLRDYASGFEWWDARDRSLQLALAILADYLNDDAKALSLHEDFTWKVVAGLSTVEALGAWQVRN